jgi:hypothetical protein
MDVLHLVLYAAASLLALRSLTSLMSSHRARYAQRRMADAARQHGAASHTAAAAKSQAALGKPAA